MLTAWTGAGPNGKPSFEADPGGVSGARCQMPTLAEIACRLVE